MGSAFLQYFNVEKMGRFPNGADALLAARMGVFSKLAAVQHATGGTVYVVSAFGKPKKYVLWESFAIEEVTKEGEQFVVSGPGKVLLPPAELSGKDFEKFKASCANFIGFRNIDDLPYTATLQKLADLVDQDTSQQDQGAPTKQAQDTQPRNDAPDQSEGIVEHQSDALPAPTNGALVTSDGKGLRFTYQYLAPKNPDLLYAYQWAAETHLLSTIPEIDGLDGLMVIPRPLRYVAAQCGTVNAFYSKDISSVVLCYEMIDSLTKMGTALAKGATDVYAYITHGVLSGGAVARISASRLKELVITDSIQPTEAVRVSRNIRVLSIGTLIGEAIARTATEESVSSLFD